MTKNVSHSYNPYRSQIKLETNGPLAIESRVARIKARVRELTGDLEPQSITDIRVDKPKSTGGVKDTRLLASGSSDKTVKIWDPATGQCVSTLQGHGGWVMSVTWSHR